MERLNRFIDYILKTTRLKHFIYWLGILLFNIIYGFGYGQSLVVTLIISAMSLPITIAAYYLFMYKQLPLIQKRKYVMFTLSFSLMAFLFAILNHLNEDYGLGTFLVSWHRPHEVIDILTSAEFTFNYIINIYSIVFLTAGFKLAKEQFDNKSVLAQLEAEKTQAEYKYLQANLQPSLLMGSVNEIRKRSMTNIDEVPRLIESLSSLLDYTLYKSNETRSLIVPEIDQVRTYIYLLSEVKDELLLANFDVQDVNDSFHLPTKFLVNYTDRVLSHLGNKALVLHVFITTEADKMIYQLNFELTGNLIEANMIEDAQRVLSHFVSNSFEERAEVTISNADNELTYLLTIQVL